MRRVEGVEPGERRDGREHGDLKAGEKSRAGWDGEAGRGAGPGGPAPARRPAAPGRAVGGGWPGRAGAPRTAPTHLLRWRQRADPLLGRQLGAEADCAPGTVTLSFADARGGATAQEAAGRLVEALGEQALPRTRSRGRRPCPPRLGWGAGGKGRGWGGHSPPPGGEAGARLAELPPALRGGCVRLPRPPVRLTVRPVAALALAEVRLAPQLPRARERR